MSLDRLEKFLGKSGFETTRHHVSARGRTPKNATRDFVVAQKNGETSSWSSNDRNGVFMQPGYPHVDNVWRNPAKHGHTEPRYFRDTPDGLLKRMGFKPTSEQYEAIPRSSLSYANLIREANDRFAIAREHQAATTAFRAEVGFNKQTAAAFERMTIDTRNMHIAQANLHHWAREQARVSSKRNRGLSPRAKDLKRDWNNSAEKTSMLAKAADGLSKSANKAAAKAETTAKAAAMANEAAAKAAAHAAEMQAKAAANAAEAAAKAAAEAAEIEARLAAEAAEAASKAAAQAAEAAAKATAQAIEAAARASAAAIETTAKAALYTAAAVLAAPFAGS